MYAPAELAETYALPYVIARRSLRPGGGGSFTAPFLESFSSHRRNVPLFSSCNAGPDALYEPEILHTLANLSALYILKCV
jgi:hypothetical protein